MLRLGNMCKDNLSSLFPFHQGGSDNLSAWGENFNPGRFTEIWKRRVRQIKTWCKNMDSAAGVYLRTFILHPNMDGDKFRVNPPSIVAAD